MARLVETPETPDAPAVDAFVLGKTAFVRLKIDGYADARWRRVYNRLAAASNPRVPAEARGHEALTVILVELPLDVDAFEGRGGRFTQKEVRAAESTLDRAAGLIGKTNDAWAKEDDPAAMVKSDAERWWRRWRTDHPLGT
jgi:hypothetical protein